MIKIIFMIVGLIIWTALALYVGAIAGIRAYQRLNDPHREFERYDEITTKEESLGD